MDKKILNDYIDACEIIKDTEEYLKKLRKKRRVLQDKVKGSNPEWPYEARSFTVQGTDETPEQAGIISREESILEKQKQLAEQLKLDVEEWLLEVPFRMQRIIRYRYFNQLSWEDVATLMGRKATGESIRAEFKRFMEEK